MSRISDLRNSEKNQINVIKIFETLMEDTKYIIMYQKLLKDMIQNDFDIIEIKKTIVKVFPELNQNKLDKLSDLEILFTLHLFTILMPIDVNKDFQLFCEYNEKKLIKRNDLQSYNSFYEVRQEVADIKKREKEKELEKQIVKIYDKNNWLIIKPLTFEASLKYGANTKWCTASKNDKDYFKQYTKDGILIYLLNKETDIKYAIHRQLINGNHLTTFWNSEDMQISFFEIEELPTDAIDVIRENVKMSVTNYQLAKEILSENKVIKKKYAGYENKSELLEEVKQQYSRNARWSEYIKTKERKHTPIATRKRRARF